MIPLLRELGDQLLGLLFPERCVGCGKIGALFCGECQRKLRPYSAPYFSSSLGSKSARDAPPALPHPDAIMGVRDTTRSIDAVFIAFQFEGVLREAIHMFKYRPLRRLGVPLGDLMARVLAAHPLMVDALIPVPLHPNRLAERGFNQSELLAQRIGQARSLPVLTNGLVRIRDTEHQVRLNAKERQENMHDAFRWQLPTNPPPRIALVDDLFTTGATFRACAVALRMAGVQEVVALALARSSNVTISPAVTGAPSVSK